MSESSISKYEVFNHRQQPVEIHLETRIVVVGPGESAELVEGELRSKHLQALQQLRLITLLAHPEEAATEKVKDRASVSSEEQEKEPSSDRGQRLRKREPKQTAGSGGQS